MGKLKEDQHDVKTILSMLGSSFVFESFQLFLMAI
jgi:hypothetical protein